MININNFPELTTARLSLRQLVETDDENIFKLRSDERVNKFIDRPKEISIETSQAFIYNINDGIANQKWFYWAICLKGESNLIGTICMWNFSDDKTEAEIGYELLPEFHGRGIMDEAVKSVIEFAKEKLRLQKILAFTHKGNEGSTKLLQRNNFRPVSNRNNAAEDNLIVMELWMKLMSIQNNSDHV